MLHTLQPARGSTHRRRRVARGNSAGGGTTAGRGTKGQQARAGKGRRFGFEGGQVPFLMRQPKLGGFSRDRHVTYEALNLATLERRLEAGTYDVASLRTQRIVTSKRPVKLLGEGSVTKKFDLTVNGASRSAKKAIEAAGGTITFCRG
ncbi:50S ribosomal protein L15 [Candidatus Peregrinibacteria bacterium]|nr:50S ribosomal protein L15 [Candidatus Peregrinibacteria bacterium]